MAVTSPNEIYRGYEIEYDGTGGWHVCLDGRFVQTVKSQEAAYDAIDAHKKQARAK